MSEERKEFTPVPAEYFAVLVDAIRAALLKIDRDQYRRAQGIEDDWTDPPREPGRTGEVVVTLEVREAERRIRRPLRAAGGRR